MEGARLYGNHLDWNGWWRARANLIGADWLRSGWLGMALRGVIRLSTGGIEIVGVGLVGLDPIGLRRLP